ncbi:TolC family protein [Fulvimonas sp. R45]|uniref:TolC family protein n=1 Tax=Fulvimonas sp. R45 TaxID=3045937 RepID=UPI00265F5C52|nr:TolC family protein [Fulvimonas sp. R45]MDO1528788.1 TolC family protein [Fulvimonas sp. R45]
MKSSARYRRLLLAAAGALPLCACVSYAPLPLGQGRGADSVAQLSAPVQAIPGERAATHRFDPADGLDVTETAMLALANDPQLRLQRDALGMARAQAFAAGLLPDPQLSLAGETPTSHQPGLTHAFNLGLDYDVGALLTRSARKAEARGKARQANLELLWSEWQTVAQARLLFDEISAARATQVRLAHEIAALEPLDRQVQAALAAGNLTYAAASAGLDALSDARRQLAEAGRARAQSEHDLRLLLGLSAQAPLPLVGPPYRAHPGQAQVDAALAALPERRPDLLALKAGYAAQEAQLRVEILRQFPAISLGFTRARDTSDVYTRGLSLGITLPLFDRNRGNIAVAKATRQQLHDDYDARLRTARADARLLQLDLASLDAQLAALRTHARQLDTARDAARDAWQAGQLDWPTYLSIRGNALAADLALIALEQERAKQAIALETLLGGDWDDRAARPAGAATS